MKWRRVPRWRSAGQGRPRHGCNRCCGPNGNGIPFTQQTLARPAQTLVGQKYPKGFLLSELRRQLAESAAYCPAIQDVGDLKQEGDTITGTVSLTTRSGERQEVFHFGP